MTSTLNNDSSTTTPTTTARAAKYSVDNANQTSTTTSSTTITNETDSQSASSPTQSKEAPAQQQHQNLRELYPPSVAYQTGTLPVDDIHTLYFEVHSGNRDNTTANTTLPNTTESTTTQKKSALFLHGGPGAGCSPTHARFFNPALYDTVVLVDQRGCGKSTPQGQIFNNTLLHLVNDCEVLRRHILGPHRVWDVVLGGSWGSTVAVAYAQEYPASVSAIILRGVCLLRPQEVDWLFTAQGGASRQAPAAWQRFCETVGMGPTSSTSSQTTTTTTKPRRPLPVMAPDQGTGLGERVLLGNPARNPFLDKTRTNQPPQQRQQSTNANNKNNNVIDRSVLHAYYDRLFGRNASERWMAARAWMAYEFAVSSSFQKSPSTTQQQQRQQQQDPQFSNKTAPETNSSNETSNNTATEMPPKSPAVLVSHASSDRWSFQDLAGAFLSPMDVASLVGFNDPAHYATTRLRRGLPFSPKSSSPPRPIEMTIHDFDPESSQKETFGNFTGFPALPMLTCFYSTNEQYATNYIDLLSPERMNKIAHIPCIAVQGGRDPICPPDTALELKQQWPAMELRIPLDAGHSMYHPELTHELVQATDRLATL